MMKMFKKKDGDPKKKVKAAVKKTAKSATKEGGSEAMQSMVKPKRVSTLKRIVKDVPAKRVPVSTLTRSVKTVLTPKPKMKPASPGLKKALGVDSLQSGKMYPFTKEAVARRDSAKTAPKDLKVMKSKLTSTPRVKATIQESRVNSRTGAVKKYPAKEMKMKSISKKEFSESKPKMQKTPWILKQTTGIDSMPSLEGKSKQYKDSVIMDTYKKGGYRIK